MLDYSFQILLIDIGFRFSDVDRENKTTSIYKVTKVVLLHDFSPSSSSWGAHSEVRSNDVLNLSGIIYIPNWKKFIMLGA